MCQIYALVSLWIDFCLLPFHIHVAFDLHIACNFKRIPCSFPAHPGCWETTRDSLEVTCDVKVKCNMDVEWQKTKIDPQRNQSVYLAHAQFNSFGGTSWGDFESGAKGIVDYVNKTDHVVIDNGAVPFGPATVMTC